MNRFTLPLSVAIFAGLAGFAVPATAATCTGLLEPVHLIHMGTHTTPATGNGTVRVQVQVNANGTHTVTHVISSTNHGDDQAALELAASSTYRPATCSGRPTTLFYDPFFHFSGSSVSSTESAGGTVATSGSPAARVEGLIRAGDYDTAKSVAQSSLASNPNDRQMQQLLGIADYYSHDYTDAAEAFSRVSPPYQYPTIVAQALASAAVVLSDTNAQQALVYAQRALSIDHSANSRFAVGVAQMGNHDYAAAIATLQSVRAEQQRDPHTAEQDRYRLDEELLKAYVSNNDVNDAQPIIDEMRRLEPSNSAPAAEIGRMYLTQAQADITAHQFDEAIALFEKAAALGDPQLSVVAYSEAALGLTYEPHPDATRIKSYADRALAIDPNDAQANFAEGISLVMQYNATRNVSLKTQALTYLNKADAEAKAAGNQTLAHNIESIINQLTGTGGTP